MRGDRTSMAANTNLIETQIRLPEFVRTVSNKADNIKSDGARTEYFRNNKLIGYTVQLPPHVGGLGEKCVRVDGGNGA